MSLATTLYRGHEVFTARWNRREPPDVQATVDQQTLDGDTGWIEVLRPTIAHRSRRQILLFLEGRAAVTDLVLFLARRRGMYSPCWLPSGHSDLELAIDIGAADPTITIVQSSYTTLMFPRESRRHLAFVFPDASIICRRVTAAVDNGATETLTLEQSLGLALAKYGSLVSFLALSRLDVDDVTIQYPHPTVVAEARLPFTELTAQMEWAGDFPADPA